MPKNGWTNTILANDDHATHTPKWPDQSEHHYLHATHTPNWKNQAEHPYLHVTHMPKN
jgi:hypothetical protein